MTEQNTGWRDISTAPKDGTPILIIGAGANPVIAFQSDVIPAWWLNPTGVKVDWFTPTHWRPLPPPPGEEDNIDTVEGIDALRADNAELKRLITHMVEAIGKGAVDSEEIVPVPGDGPPYRFHEEWVHYARSALSTKEGEQE